MRQVFLPINLLFVDCNPSQNIQNRKMDPEIKSFLSPRDLAKAIGASESSLKRWVDDGLIRVSRTAGGHRRIPLTEAVRFIRAAGITLADPECIGLPPIASASNLQSESLPEECAEMFRELRGREVEQRLFAAFLAGSSVAEICDGPIRLALQHVGEIYREDPSGITVEHTAVEHCVRVLNTIRNVITTPEAIAPLAIGGAVAGNPYVLPSLSVAAVLEELGFRAVNAGANLPLDALATMAVAQTASIIWRTSNNHLDQREQRNELQGLQELSGRCDSTSVVGGGGFDADLARKYDAHSFDSLVEFSGFARGFLAISRDSLPDGKRAVAN
jgi:methanogenic corrinoid protein MtbC1